MLLLLVPACLALVVFTPAALASAGFGVTEPNFEAGTCEVRGCEYSSPPGDFFTQAAGHPEWGITAFELNHNGSGVPEGGGLKRLRVDVPPGLAANPQAPTPACTKAQFESSPKGCPASSIAGEVEMKALVELIPGVPIALPTLSGTVYNLQLEAGLPLLFGVTVEPLAPLVAPVKLFLEGHVSDAAEPTLTERGIVSGDYHEWFEIDNVPTKGEVLGGVKAPLKVLKSKLLFKGRAGGSFLTLPSVCAASTTSYLEVESYVGERSSTPTKTPVGVDGCGAAPFEPTAQVIPATSQSDAPDGARTEIHVPQQELGTEINTADIRDVRLLLPEGLTLNPSAAGALAACDPAEIGIGTTSLVTCPPESAIGSVALETPDLPPGSLTGTAYLGDPNGLPIAAPPFTVYIDLESIYDVSVRLQGLAAPNPETGRLEVTFSDNPQLPFSDLVLTLNGGPRAPLANPLVCGIDTSEARFAPWTGLAERLSTAPFAVDADGKGGACPSPLPFALAQTTQDATPTAGAYTGYTFTLERGQGEQDVQRLSTVLPAGLLGEIPAVPLCDEPAAASGSCPASSQIGTADVLAGSGEAQAFSGPVYLTGPIGGNPYGLSIPVEAAAGPFDLGRLTTLVGIGVDPHTARVVATVTLPTIFKGVPLRLRQIGIKVGRPSFLFNPTNCGPLQTESVVTSTFGSASSLSSPFTVTGCGALPFTPSFSASTSANTSRATGASLHVELTQGPHQANIHSVVVQLPAQLPSRLTTLQKACAEATFAADPRSCPAASLVGSASVTTPVLPGVLSGPAYLVSHGGAAFPDLHILLQGDGVSVVLEGTTSIIGGVTTSTFGSIPDVPVSSFELTLPSGPYSALFAYGSFCAGPLTMPTTITAQSGAVFSQKTHIAVTGCGVRILRTRVRHHALLVTVQTFAAGSLKLKGIGLRTARRRLTRAATVTLRVGLSARAIRALRAHRRRKVRVRVFFVPAARGEQSSSASARATFRH